MKKEKSLKLSTGRIFHDEQIFLAPVAACVCRDLFRSLFLGVQGQTLAAVDFFGEL